MVTVENRKWLTVFEGEDGAEGTPPEGDKGGEGDKKPEDFDPPKKDSFTQEEMNKIFATQKREFQAKQNKLLDELEALKAKSNLTTKDRTELEERLETMRNEYLSKEQQIEKNKNKMKMEYDNKIKDLTEQRDLFVKRFTDSTILRDIKDGATKHKAISPRQVEALLRPDTRLVDVLDDEGEPTGEMIAKVKFKDVDKAGKLITLELPVEEAIKRMKEMPEHQNLFQLEGAGGVSGSSGRPNAPQDFDNIVKDPKAYRKAVAEGKIFVN